MPSQRGSSRPPWWIRSVLILTCTGVSFAHGSNNGQKGMGLIMLILIGTAATAYALNRTPAPNQVESFRAPSTAAAAAVEKQAAGYRVLGDPRPAVTVYVSQRKMNEGTYVSLAALINQIAAEVDQYGSLAKIRRPPSATPVTTCTSPPKRCVSR
jgi:PiT family inorganic phosphate transporter